MIREYEASGKKKGLIKSPFLIQIELTIVDVHCYFKTETQVCVAWCFPFHSEPPEVCLNYYASLIK